MYVLVADDDATLSDILRRELHGLGITAEIAATIADAEICLAAQSFDVIMLDINFPDGSGLDLLATLRRHDRSTPVLLLSGRNDVADRVLGLDTGADDYLSKPFRVSELVARLRALGRRRTRGEIVLTRGDLVLEPTRLSVSIGGRRIDLSPREVALLDALMRWPGMVQSKQDLEARIYGWQEGVESNTIEVHVHNLRAKIGRHRIETIRGAGYRLRSSG
jgi:DNA-binding response OmpR family regulator